MLGAFVRALGEALEARSRNAGGDYSPDPNAQRFPAWEAPRGDAVPVRRIGPKVTMTGLVADWWKEAEATGLKPSTHLNYSKSVGLLSRFLGHDDAARVTPEDILCFKDRRLATKHPRPGGPSPPRP